MIPKHIAAEIKQACPRVTLLQCDDSAVCSLGVELDGARIAWTFLDTPENWQRAKTKALHWLADHLEK